MREKKLCLLATGGTIACVQGADGLRPALSGEALLQAVPELAAYGDIKVSELFALDSSNLLPAHWQQMARAIVERYDDFDGFVLTHGTDTMGYTAGALYYMLRGLGKPVVLTGSMLPLQAAGTDAKANLRGAFAVAASGRAGVYQAFAGRIIAGNAVKKVDSTARDAFRSIWRGIRQRQTRAQPKKSEWRQTHRCGRKQRRSPCSARPSPRRRRSTNASPS